MICVRHTNASDAEDLTNPIHIHTLSLIVVHFIQLTQLRSWHIILEMLLLVANLLNFPLILDPRSYLHLHHFLLYSAQRTLLNVRNAS